MSETTCPECKGEGRHVAGPFCDQPYEHEAVDGCCCGGSVSTTCRVCRGSGKLDEITLAVYRARGGAAPVARRGFA